MKAKVSQDELYEFLTGHDVKLSRIAELIGQSMANVSAYFLHHKNVHGCPRRFSAMHIERLNAALPIIASELRGCLLQFGSDQVRTNKWGRSYDPALIEPMKRVGNWINMPSMTERLLGWSKLKNRNVLADTHSKVYGNISSTDVTIINAELLTIAGVLDGWEVVADEVSSSSSSI